MTQQGIQTGLHLATHYRTVKIKYDADELKRKFWVSSMKPSYKSASLWDQEQEVRFDAYLGQLVYPEFQREFTVIRPRQIPPDATHYMAIDPHPRTPHAFLWMYVDRYENHVYYADFWASKIYGTRGNAPEDDDLFRIDEYAKTMEWFEGPEPDMFAPNGYVDNEGHPRKIYMRIMDQAGKSWAANREMGKDEPKTFWDVYSEGGDGWKGLSLHAAHKEFQAGRDKVGTKLRPRKYVYPDGIEEHSQILVFDTCRELILELGSVRYPTLKPGQIPVRDPIETPLEKRDHFTDLLRYIEMADPIWIDPNKRYMQHPKAEPLYESIPGFVR